MDPPPKGEALWNLLLGWMREVADRDLSRSASATSLIQPTNGFQGLPPLAEVQEAEPPGGVRGNAPAPVGPCALTPRRTALRGRMIGVNFAKIATGLSGL